MQPIDMDEFYENYKLNRIIYVNSANHGYSEIMLNNHLALFGNNNMGKTASLAGLKLALFPEINFKNCEKKFQFKGKKGFYSQEESYHFYFPSANSFIILEVENLFGMFCMVLSRKSDFTYDRYFIPCQYEELRPLFWDEEGEDFNKSMSTSLVSSKMKSLKGVYCSETKDIVDLMFGSFRSSKDKKRFCTIPLKTTSKESVEAFRGIYQLAFDDSTLQEKTLPEAIATLIEMEKNRSEEKLDANLDQLNEEHAELLKKKHRLKELQNAHPAYLTVKSNIDPTKNVIELLSKTFSSVEHALIRAQTSFGERYTEASKSLGVAQSQFNQLKQETETLEKQISGKQATLHEKTRSLSVNVADFNKAKKVFVEYGNSEITDLLIEINGLLKKAEDNLFAYRNEDSLQNKIKGLVNGINTLKTQIISQEKSISEAALSFFNQLNDTHVKNVIHSLNPGFEGINAELNAQEKEVINSFAGLFDIDGKSIRFLGQKMNGVTADNYDFDEMLERLRLELKESKRVLLDKEKEFNELSEAVSNTEGIPRLITETQLLITKYETQKELIGTYPKLVKTTVADKAEVEAFKEEIYQQGKFLSKEKLRLSDEVFPLYDRKKEARDSLDEEGRQTSSIEKTISSIRGSCPFRIEDIAFESIELSELYPQASLLGSTILMEANKSFSALKNGLIQLQARIPRDGDEQFKDHQTLPGITEAFDYYRNEFETLSFEESQLSNSIRNHNQLISNQLQELQESRRALKKFTDDINEELNEKKVSNLDEIRLDMVLHPRFVALIKTLERHDIEDDTLLPLEFYQSLIEFTSKFFNKKTRQLRLKDMIASIEYHYRINGSTDWQTKSQSGGTTSTITAFVLSVLLKRITPLSVSLSIPIVVDEISTIDSDNTDATLKQISSHGFSIFCATPTFTPLVASRVKSWIFIDQFTVQNPIVENCHAFIMPSYIQGYGEQGKDGELLEV